MTKLRVAVIGAGAFGRNHVRVITQLPNVTLAAVVDPNEDHLNSVSTPSETVRLKSVDDLPETVDAAILVTPTQTHEAIGTQLLNRGVDVLIEKPIATSSEAGERLSRIADERERILQVGHLERFNPAVMALTKMVTVPLFFEVHRLSVFTPRSLDIDVVLDLMIHDLDIVLSLAKEFPVEIRAAGISVLSPKVDIANVRLAFPSGCVANLTASRVSTERVRKLRLFQPGQYISLDYARQEAVSFSVKKAESGGDASVDFSALSVEKAEPLEQELRAFFDCVRSRKRPVAGGCEAIRALRVAEEILVKIKEHGDLVTETVRQHGLRS